MVVLMNTGLFGFCCVCCPEEDRNPSKWPHSGGEANLRGELGDGLGALRDGVLGELAGEDKADGSLDLAGREGGLLVEAGELAGLSSDALEDVVDERVEDSNALLGDADLCEWKKWKGGKEGETLRRGSHSEWRPPGSSPRPKYGDSLSYSQTGA
jgi:hypothetical protein